MYLRIILTLLTLTAIVIATELAVRRQEPTSAAAAAGAVVPLGDNILPPRAPVDDPCLQKRIASLDMPDAALHEAFAAIAKAADLNMIWPTTEPDLGHARILLKDVTVEQALDRTLAAFEARDLEYRAVDGIVVIKRASGLGDGDTRIYPVYDLLANRHAKPTTQPGPYFSNQEDPMEQLVRIIMNSVSPENWRDNGGVVGSIRVWDGLLVITQNRKGHAAVERLLAEMRRGSHMPATRP